MIVGKAVFMECASLCKEGVPPAQENGQAVEKSLDRYKERSHSLPFLCNDSSRFLCSIRPQETQLCMPWLSCDWGKWQRGQVQEAWPFAALAPPSMRGGFGACLWADRYRRLPIFTV